MPGHSNLFVQKTRVGAEIIGFPTVSRILTASFMRFLFISTASYQENLQSKHLTASCPFTYNTENVYWSFVFFLMIFSPTGRLTYDAFLDLKPKHIFCIV